MTHRQKVTQLVIAVVFILSIVFGFGAIYFNDHAWGAWGDDSAGYIYLAGRMWQDQSLVYYDGLAKAGYDFFGDEKLARWLTPTHHQFINTRGVLASKYPVGLSLIMYSAAKLFNSDLAFYYVIPALAVLNLVLMYILALGLFEKHRYRHVIGLMAVFMLGVSDLYYDYAIAQPMREIPSMTFLLLMAVCVIYGLKYSLKNKNRLWLYGTSVIAGLALGMAFNIRETSLMVMPAVFVFVLFTFWKKRRSVQYMIIRTLVYFLFFSTACIVALIPTINNSYQISKEKEVFKARDTSEVVILSNMGHVESLSIENLFNNQGKFRPGKGSLPHYWNIMQKASPLPYLLVLVAFGMVYYWRESRSRTAFLILWILGFLTIFSLWVNPYSRYILPLFPVLFLLAAYGLMMFCQQFIPAIIKKRKYILALVVLMIGSFIAGYQPILAQVQENIQTDVYRFKAIARSDLDSLISLGNNLNKEDQSVLMFSGDWQYGTSETLETHTGLKTIRFPLEQRFVFNEAEVDRFFDQMLNSGYTLYVWIDETSSDSVFEWMTKYNLTLIQQEQFTFQSDVRIYQVNSLKK